MLKKISPKHFIYIFLITFIPLLSLSNDIQQEKQRLDEIREDLQRYRNKRNKAQKKERSALQKLQDSEREIELIQSLLQELNRKEERTNQRIEKTQQDLKETEKKLEEQQDLMALRLREIYKFYKVNELESLLTAQSFTDVLERQRYFELIAQQDQTLYEEIENSKKQIETKKIRLENILLTLKELQVEQKKEQSIAIAERQNREKVLVNVRTQKQEAEKAIRDLEKAQTEVQSIINKLEKQRKKGASPAPKFSYSGNHYLDKNKGRIPWPTSGKLKSRYGPQKHPVFKTQTFNKGIDISAKKGAPIKSICDGLVVYVSWFRGYGKYLIIDHGEGYYSLYAHLSSIIVKADSQVSTGEIIGYVGDTGSLIGDALHFELRKNGDPIDPMKYLKK